MNNLNLRSQGPFELRGRAHSYAWGKVGAASRIATFLKSYEPLQPLAEYWLGTHPKGPSDIVLPSGELAPLSTVLESHNSISFMLKVLSINPDVGLSIQSHPDAHWAKILHQRDPLNYPDESHKPEIGVALSPVTLLLGFRALSELAQVVREFPAFEEVWGEDLVTRLRFARAHEPALLKELFQQVLHAPEKIVASVVSEMCEFEGRVDRFTEELTLLGRLRQCYGDRDRGLLAVFMMNIVHLKAGEGVFIGPNCPHAYLDGDLVECMASSDNVIRAGLTPKFKDTATLLETVSYDDVELSGIVSATGTLGDLSVFDLPIGDFALATTSAGSSSVSLGALSHDAIMLCVGGQTEIVCAARSLRLGDGGAAFLPAMSGPYAIARKDAALFLATRL